MFNFICTVTLYLVIGWVMYVGYKREEAIIREVLDVAPAIVTKDFWIRVLDNVKDAWRFGLREVFLVLTGILALFLLPLIMFYLGVVQVVDYIVNKVKDIKRKLHNFTKSD